MRLGHSTMCLMSWLLFSWSSLAQPLVEEARAQLGDADFAGALETIEQAEASTGLSLDDLVDLYELKAMVYRALGNAGGVDDSLLALGSLDEGHTFGPEIVPEIRSRFSELRVAPLSLRARPRESETMGFQLAVSMTNDPANLAQEVHIHVRMDGDSWTMHRGESIQMPATPGDRIEWYVEVLGPGGATIIVRGSRDAPEVFVVGGEEEDPGGGRRRPSPWVWVGVGLGVAAVIAVVVGVTVASQQDPDTQVTGPYVDGF